MGDEMNSPLPTTITVRRNPVRRARATPLSKIPVALPFASPLPKITTEPNADSSAEELINQIPVTEENLKVFLRIRPLTVQKLKERKPEPNVWPRNNPKTTKCGVKKESKSCIEVVDDHSVVVSPPIDTQASKRFKSEAYEGFSCVFSADSSQSEVYEKMVSPLVKDLLNGKSGALAALGPSGSGKTHTVFGCARDPGMVTRVLRQMFSQESNETHMTRTFHLSMFEISSEKGKSERLCDLLQEGVDVSMQQSSIKGLKEVILSEVQQAESIIACGMLKRATATTNSNSQSSRSQCIINIRCSTNKVDGETEDGSCTAVLTIVDLAGAEREKRTGNQGHRLLESNFINNTSMVFNLCLRSLLEHQKNPKKPLQMNFQNSLLTRYLKLYLEGKKPMALVLTVKPGEEDYLDTSNLLKQAAPFSQIRFNSTQEPEISKCAKRPQMSQRKENKKRIKVNGPEVGEINEKIMDEQQQSVSPEKKEDDCLTEIVEAPSTALLNVLNEYKEKLKAADNELSCLRATLENEQKIRADLENEVRDLQEASNERNEVRDNELTCLRATLENEWKIRAYLENEIRDLKSQISHWQETSNKQMEAASCKPCGDVEESKDSGKSKAGDSDSIGGAKKMYTDHGLVNQEKEESAKTSTIDSKDVKNDVVGGHLDNGTAEDFSESNTLTSLDGTTVNCIMNQEHEVLAEKTSSITVVPDFKDDCEKGHLDNGNAEDISESSTTSLDGTTSNCIINQEHEVRAEKTSSIVVRDFQDDCEKGHLNNEIAEDILVLRVEDSIDNESEETDHSESSVSSSESCAATTEGSAFLAVETDELAKNHREITIDLCVKASLNENKSPSKGHEDDRAPEIASKHADCNKPEITEKRKRRLLPASSNLLKDMGTLALEDANDKPKGAKGEKKVFEDMKNISKGSVSLLRMLRNRY